MQIDKEIAKMQPLRSNSLDTVQKIAINNRPIIIKKSTLDQGIASTASSIMYKKIGISTPELYIIKNQKGDKSTATFQLDVSSIDGFITTLASDSIQFCEFNLKPFGRWKWEIFNNPELIATLLKFMTPRCLEQLQNAYLAHELRTDNDLHKYNFFFYRTTGSNKYQGIIIIDLDNMIVLNYCNGTRDEFNNFLYAPFGSITPQQTTDYLSHFTRMDHIRQLIQDGILTQGNIDTLKASLTFDFPNEIKTACKQRGISKKTQTKIVDTIKYLWDYNQKTLGKDLGL